MAAILTCYLLGIDVSFMKKTLENFSVKGRIEPVKVSDDFLLLIDYAHNGISTKSILSTIRQYNPGRIVTIFGCGGNRSRERRYEMGAIASQYSDKCIITEDNNRYEKFVDIAKHLVLPVFVLSFVSVAGIQRQMRSNMLEIMNEDFIKFARAKGLDENTIKNFFVGLANANLFTRSIANFEVSIIPRIVI